MFLSHFSANDWIKIENKRETELFEIRLEEGYCVTACTVFFNNNVIQYDHKLMKVDPNSEEFP